MLADAKIADDAAYEVALCLDAGARAVTVLGVAEDATIDAVVARAETVIDLMATSPERRDALVARHPGRGVLGARRQGRAARRPVGVRRARPVGGGALARRRRRPGRADVARLAREYPGARAIVGAAISGADDPVQAVKEFQ